MFLQTRTQHLNVSLDRSLLVPVTMPPPTRHQYSINIFPSASVCWHQKECIQVPVFFCSPSCGPLLLHPFKDVVPDHCRCFRATGFHFGFASYAAAAGESVRKIQVGEEALAKSKLIWWELRNGVKMCLLTGPLSELSVKS